MKDRTISIISLGIAFSSLCISGYLGWNELNSSRESVSIQRLGLGEISLRSGLELSQTVLVSNHSTRTVSIADSTCSVFSKIKGRGEFYSGCHFLGAETLPVVIAPGEARALPVKVSFYTSDSLLWTIGQWKTRYPDQDAMCFLGYLLNTYGRDFAGNKYKAEAPELPEPRTPPEFSDGSKCGYLHEASFSSGWSLMRSSELASLLASTQNEDIYFQSFRVTLKTTRGNSFSSEQIFGSFGFPGF